MAFWIPLLIAAGKAAAASAAAAGTTAAISAATPKQGMTQPGQARMMSEDDALRGLASLVNSTKSQKQPLPQLQHGRIL